MTSSMRPPEMTPELLMRTYLDEVVAQGRLELIEELANADMVDEANQAFGGPPGRAGLVAHVKGFRRNIGNLQVTVDRIVAGRGVLNYAQDGVDLERLFTENRTRWRGVHPVS